MAHTAASTFSLAACVWFRLDLETNALEHEQDDENGDERLNLLMAEGQPATFMTIIQEASMTGPMLR